MIISRKHENKQERKEASVMNEERNHLLILVIVILTAVLFLDNVWAFPFHFLWPIVLFWLSYHFYKKQATMLCLLFGVLALVSFGVKKGFDSLVLFLLVVFLLLYWSKRKHSSKVIDIDKDL